MTTRRTGLARLALMAGLALAAALPPLARAAAPEGFVDALVAEVTEPVALAVPAAGPDRGAVYVAGKEGVLFRIDPAGGAPVPALDLSSRTCTEGERGMLGVAFDPQLEAGFPFVYVYYTAADGGACFNRVSRFPVTDSGAIDAAGETELLRTADLDSDNHNGGDLHFGADGFLYVSVGDNKRDQLAQQRSSFFGKILRVTRDGDPAPGNPWTGKKTADCAATGQTAKKACREVFAVGLRNPFRFAFQPGTSTFLINDVGEHEWEEIDLGAPGANYGWPEREGPCPTGRSEDCPPAKKKYTDPVWSYRHDQPGGECESITAGAFVPESSGWPAAYLGDYLFADYVCATVFRLENPLGAAPAAAPFLTQVGDPWLSAIDMTFDPTDPGRLLYTTYAGEVRALTWGGA